MKKSFLLIGIMAVIAICSNVANAQSMDYAPSRWQVGGGIGFGLGGDFTNINISPMVRYNINDYLTVGGGMSYSYYADDYYDFTENYFGMNVFASVQPLPYISLFVQPEGYRRWARDYWGQNVSDFVPCMLVGGGLLIPTGPRSGMSMMIYYDVLQEDYSPHGDQLGYSIGYTFSL